MAGITTYGSGIVLGLAAAVAGYNSLWSATWILAAGAVAIFVITTPGTQTQGGGVEVGYPGELFAALELGGAGIHVMRGRQAKLLVAATNTTRVPASDEVILRGRAGHVGLFITAPAANLWREFCQFQEPTGGGAEGVDQMVKLAHSKFQLWRDFKLGKGKKGFKASFQNPSEVCVQAHQSTWSTQGCCQACSFIGVAAAHAYGKPIRVTSSNRDGELVTKTFEVVA